MDHLALELENEQLRENLADWKYIAQLRQDALHEACATGFARGVLVAGMFAEVVGIFRLVRKISRRKA